MKKRDSITIPYARGENYTKFFYSKIVRKLPLQVVEIKTLINAFSNLN